MKIFIDSAELSEIEKVYCCGILDGITTNPSLINPKEYQLIARLYSRPSRL